MTSRTDRQGSSGSCRIMPVPRQADAVVRAIRQVMATNVRSRRAAPAPRHGAEVGRADTTGHRLGAVAEAPDRGQPEDRIAPLRRVIGGSTPTAKWLIFRPDAVADRRRREGPGL